MSFGLNIGATIDLATRLRREFARAPSQFRAISDEFRSLSIILQDVEVDLMDEGADNDDRKAKLQNILDGCHNILKELEQTLDKYDGLQPHSAQGDLDKVKRVRDRFNWDPEVIRDLRDRMTSNVTLLNTFRQGLTSRATVATKVGVDRLNQRQDDQDCMAILNWLTPIDYTSQQNDFFGRRQEGTGQWLLDSQEYKTWSDSEGQTLFCPGIPGAGKTILTSIVTNHLSTRYRDDPSIGIAYIYCNFRRQDEQKVDYLLAGLLRQLVKAGSRLPASVREFHKKHEARQTRPSLEEISTVLRSVTSIYSRVFVVVDALDECQMSEGCRRKFLSELFSLQDKIKANIFVTSRFIPEITDLFKMHVSLEIRASEEDVRRYLVDRMDQLPSFVRRSPSLQEEIITGVVDAVNGMFLLAQLHLDSLKGKRSVKALRSALEKLASGSDAYDHAYRNAMERIEGQLKDEEELAKQALMWITCAKRRLTTEELQHALAVEIGKPELDEENLTEIEDIISVCAGLVTVDDESDIIRLVHYTTQEYFERTQSQWFPEAPTSTTMVCVSYLSFSIFESGICSTKENLKDRLRSNRLYPYAAHHWGHHAREAPACIASHPVIISFLESKSKVESSCETLDFRRYFGNRTKSQGIGMTGLHLAAYFGVEHLVRLMLGREDPNLRDKFGMTALFWAVDNGHATVTQLLLVKGADPNPKIRKHRYP